MTGDTPPPAPLDAELAGRIAVTGIGAVTPVGTGRAAMWESLLAGRSGFSPVVSFDTARHTVHLGAEIHGFRPEEHVRTLDPARLGRASQLAIAAARLALADAGIGLDTFDGERAGVSMGTTS
ncbi:MAG TPA: beta-ketoacyl synthase N-terminal-like domain-containing protein, partial [Thermoanaerobaculia bacterium]